MNNSENEARWIYCPVCGNKTRTRVFWNTVLVCFPLYCPKCKEEMVVDVVQFKMVPSKIRPASYEGEQ